MEASDPISAMVTDWRQFGLHKHTNLGKSRQYLMNSWNYSMDIQFSIECEDNDALNDDECD